MSKTIELTDEQYQIIQYAAEQRGHTPDTLLGEWIEEMRDPYTSPRYFSEDEFLSHLGMTDEMIRQAEDLVARDEGAEDADV